MGYHRAGFWIIGADVVDQPQYPFCFVKMDALEFIRKYAHMAAVIHGSPPCHAFSSLRALHQGNEYPDLVDATRQAMIATGLPYVIENVPNAPLIDPIMLCGTMFGLETAHGSQLRRHRMFEVPWMKDRTTPSCNHREGSAIGVHGGGQHPNRRVPATISVTGASACSSNRDGTIGFGIEDRRAAMGIDWISGKALSQAIPPAYTEWIGTRLMGYLKDK